MFDCRSGEEGRYPELEDFAEKRLASQKPDRLEKKNYFLYTKLQLSLKKFLCLSVCTNF